MKIEKIIKLQTLLLRLEGELDMQTAEAFRQAMDHEIDRRKIRTVILNLQGVNFIDSSGLGVILGRYKKLAGLGGKIYITNVQPQVLKIMQLSGFSKIIEFFSDETSAYEEGRVSHES